jgi:DNA-binding response OmpR family regulator
MLPLNGPVIWLVEDDQSTQRLIAEYLMRHGMRPVLFDTAEKAYHAFQTQPMPALMILDMMLPGMSGVDLIRLLKQNPEWEKVPVVVVTVMSRSDVTDATEPPSAYWLNKPFDAGHLIETIQQILAVGRKGA